MEAHEKYLLDKLSFEHCIQVRDEKISALTEEVSSLNTEVSSLSTEVSSLTSKNTSLSTENAKLLTLLKQNGFSEEQIASYLKK
jgi:peptidoglycan hydrolase CwlO-like protein